MKVVNQTQAETIDRLSTEQYSIPSLDLMENAGQESYQLITRLFPDYQNKKFLVICGGGNNGGDGAVVARLLHQQGVEVSVCYLSDMQLKTGDKKTNYDRLKQEKLSVVQCLGAQEWQESFRAHQRADILIDALFGIGFHGTLDPFLQDVITDINSFPVILSLDICSGLPADSPAQGETVHADYTITFGSPKLSQVDYPGKAATGELSIVDIGFPEQLTNSESITTHFLQEQDIRQALLPRPASSHKGNYGHVLIIGGQRGMTGAVKHAGLAALRAGAGLVTLSVDKGREADYGAYPELMLLSHDDPDQILQFIQSKKISTILSGCGWGQGVEQEVFLEHILKLDSIRLILDADALNIISRNKQLQQTLIDCNSECILTPHLKEFSRLTGETIPYIRSNKLDLAGEFCSKYHCTLILKDSVSLICDNTGKSWFNSTGNNSLAKGGSGDILAGLVAGLCASGHLPRDASQIACYVLGHAAGAYIQQHSSRSAIPRDILELLPFSFKEIE